MQLTYDLRHKCCLPPIAGKIDQVETIRVSEELHIDLAPDGTFTVSSYSTLTISLHAEDQGKLIVINEAAGDRREIDFT